MQETYTPVWDLDVIFSGGSGSEAYQTYVENIKEQIKALSSKLAEFNPKQEGVEGSLGEIIDDLELTMIHLRQSGAFVSCLSAQNVKDEGANILAGNSSALLAEFGAVLTDFKEKISAIPAKAWEKLFENDKLKDLEYILNEYRENAKDLLPLEQEIIINDLAVDGYHAWNQMYSTIVGNMRGGSKKTER